MLQLLFVLNACNAYGSHFVGPDEKAAVQH